MYSRLNKQKYKYTLALVWRGTKLGPKCPYFHKVPLARVISSKSKCKYVIRKSKCKYVKYDLMLVV